MAPAPIKYLFEKVLLFQISPLSLFQQNVLKTSKLKKMNNTYQLQIWKMNANKQQTSDDPFVVIPFEFERDDTVDYDTRTQLHTVVEGMVKKNLPVIDCDGWEAIVIDEEGEEVIKFDDYYIGK